LIGIIEAMDYNNINYYYYYYYINGCLAPRVLLILLEPLGALEHDLGACILYYLYKI